MALEGTIAILEAQLLRKEELYKRWTGATQEEIAEHFNKGELRVYERYKGPINSIIWCKPGNVYYRNSMSFANPSLYGYDDDSCDYFLLEDVVQCENEHPEYTGDITPESLGLVQVEVGNAPDDEPEYIQAESLRKDMRMSPVQFVAYLREHRVLALFGNEIDDGSRNWFYNNASREQAAEMLGGMCIHCLDIVAHKKRIADEADNFPIPDDAMSHIVDSLFPVLGKTDSIEPSLAQDLWVEVESYISLSDLLKRWECDVTHINELMYQGIVTCYEVREWVGFRLNTPKGIKRISVRGLQDEDQWRAGIGSFIFPLIDIDMYEASASAQELDFMKAGPLFPSERKAFKKQEGKISELEANLAETQKRLKDTEEELEYTQAQASDATVLLEDAEEEIEKKDARIAELESQPTSSAAELVTTVNAAAPSLTPQQKAALARQEKTLNVWKPCIAAMIKVAVRCGEEGRKLRQQPDFNLMFNELDAELNGEQGKFFRESLPDEHIDRLGGARGKTDPPDNA